MDFCQRLGNWSFQPPLQLRGVGIYSHGCKQGCFQPVAGQPRALRNERPAGLGLGPGRPARSCSGPDGRRLMPCTLSAGNTYTHTRRESPHQRGTTRLVGPDSFCLGAVIASHIMPAMMGSDMLNQAPQPRMRSGRRGRSTGQWSKTEDTGDRPDSDRHRRGRSRECVKQLTGGKTTLRRRDFQNLIRKEDK